MAKYLKTALIFLMMAVFFIIDRLAKWLFFGLWRRAEFPLIGDWFKLKLSLNDGIAFSLPINSGLIIGLTILILAVLVYFGYKTIIRKQYWELSGYLLIIFGAISNLIDRLMIRQVIDYIDVSHFSVFNLADAMIVVGVGLLIILSLKTNQKNS